MRGRRQSSYKRYEKKMRFHRNKALIIGGIALGVLIIAALLAVFFLNRKAEREIKYISMGEPTIPTVTMTYHDRQINRLFGYSTEMNIRYMRDNIYILENTYDIPTVIENSEKLPENITLRVYDPLTDNLIQDNKVEGISRDGKNILMNLKIENIIREGQEYMLDLLVDYGSDVQAHYYTRIRRDVTTTLAQQIDALLEYNSAVYDLDNEDSYNLVWRTIESNLNKEPNRDFGHVTLFANMNHMRWGKLTPKPITDPFVNVVDVDGELGYFLVTYLAESFENNRQELYSISEYYRMRVTDSYSYVLNYERNADEIFVPDETVIATKSADLGIRSTSELECMSSPSGTIDCFVVNGALWAMNTDEKSITRIFSFAEGDDPVRGADMQYDIRIVNMEDSGDVQFLVYGYMGRGMHEGMAGLAMFKYFADRDEVVEEMFVPSDLPHDILKQSVGELCYLNDKGVLYIILNEYLYALNVNTNETMVVADHLTSENYCVSPSAHIIAWQEGGKINDAESINVWDMEAEKGYVVKAEAGCAVRVFGFLNRDLAYGQGTKGKTYTTADDKEHLLMDQMIVRNDANQETQRKLSAPGFYTGAVPEYNRVIVKRVEPVTVSAEEGTSPVAVQYEEAEDFTMFVTDLDDYPSPKLYTEYEEIKKTINLVEFVDKTTQAGDLKVNKNTEVLFSDIEMTNIGNILTEEGRFYVYAKGQLMDIFTDAGDAIKLAYKEGGVVINDKGERFYLRGIRPSAVELSEVSTANATEAFKAGNYVNVSGIDLTEALYFTGSKKPLVVEYDGADYLITGYDYLDNLFFKGIVNDMTFEVPYDALEDSFPQMRCYVVQE